MPGFSIDGRYYILDDQHQPVATDPMTWERWFADHERRRVARTDITPDIFVSTVFLGTNYEWRGGPPLIFESMAFGLPDGGEPLARYSTWEEAETGHAAMVARVRELLASALPRPSEEDPS